MPEADTGKEKNFLEDVATPNQGSFLKGANAYDWGMKNRLARIFRPDTGRTVMLGDRPRVLSGADERPRAGGPWHRADRPTR